MPLYLLDETLAFPPVEMALEDGLLAVGGDLSPERLLLAYRSGIFPWYDEEPKLWWSPDPRFVLFPSELRISKSMRPYLNQGKFEFRINSSFRKVMESCSQVARKGQAGGTWIQPEIIDAYCQLHEAGYAISAEAWEQDQLVGGLYGIRMGPFFFGESMFSQKPNASKFSFIKLVRHLQEEGVELVDCQVYTPHLESLGARMIPRARFIELLQKEFAV
ncbi:leucyl/phenylalanyl-tRNA--protein transferase [Flavihumibacter sp. CACIAM 22H1]|uniref:leucyl/phenylalanyl-tRNA--protein transferase n=1 Tax=Flavihumibacter sp. CACIAM 22H1 TaxID=1812911 RepID=UPI0007A8304E|nr:leucyl/phenylalanyl-tRNA--protein transferase [Flavihumibacter sp. CACIAM 22H1]KYP14014.1 MAG: leucyl/phenylalanyl-tRNA--protein transferase [Flavihumibacter sp. CACIAM 22H1]